MSRGPRYTNRYKLTGSDTPEDCLRRLGEMAADPVRRERIRLCAGAIYDLASACGSDIEASGRGHSTHSVSMKIRHFHNELEFHVHRHCLGALYRSQGVADLAKSQGLRSHLLRQEHTIPTNVLAGMIFHGIREQDICGPEDLCRFLLTQSVVTAITRAEDITMLMIPRFYGVGRSPSAWSYTHPDFCKTDKPNRFEARPFLRYHKTGVVVTFWPTGETIDLETDTLADHVRRVEQLPLYDRRTFFENLPVAA